MYLGMFLGFLVGAVLSVATVFALGIDDPAIGFFIGMAYSAVCSNLGAYIGLKREF